MGCLDSLRAKYFAVASIFLKICVAIFILTMLQYKMDCENFLWEGEPGVSTV